MDQFLLKLRLLYTGPPLEGEGQRRRHRGRARRLFEDDLRCLATRHSAVEMSDRMVEGVGQVGMGRLKPRLIGRDHRGDI